MCILLQKCRASERYFWGAMRKINNMLWAEFKLSICQEGIRTEEEVEGVCQTGCTVSILGMVSGSIPAKICLILEHCGWAGFVLKRAG